MSDQPHRRTCLGKHFSEGSRRLWLLLDERGWDQGDLAADVLAARATLGAPQPSPEPTLPKRANTSVVNRWLYGDRAPDRDSSLLLQELYGFDPKLWSTAPEVPFDPPAARDAA